MLSRDLDDFLAYGEDFESARAPGRGGRDWRSLLETPVESERNNTVTQFVGGLARAGVGLGVAALAAHAFNAQVCAPPLPEWEVDHALDSYAEWEAAAERERRSVSYVVLDKETGKIESVAKDGDPSSRRVYTSDEVLDLYAQGVQTEWLVPRLLVDGGVHLLCGPSGTGKSLLAMDLARCVAGGYDWMGLRGVSQGAVFYLDAEMSVATCATRLRGLRFERGLPFHLLTGEEFNLASGEDRGWLKAQIDALGVRLVVIDSILGASPGVDENDSGYWSALRPKLESFGATTLLIHHPRKSGQGDSPAALDAVGGSRYIAGMAQQALYLERSHGVLTLSVIKNRHLPEEDLPRISYTVAKERDGETDCISLNALGVDQAADLLAERVMSRAKAAVAAALFGKGGVTQTDLLAMCPGVGKPALVAAIKAGVESGEIWTEKRGNSTLLWAQGENKEAC